MNAKTSFLLCILLTSFSVFAQKDSAKIKTKNKVIIRDVIINGEGDKTAKPTQNKNTKPNFAFKINPLSITKGEIPIHFEKNISKKITFEIAPIVTIREISYDILGLKNIYFYEPYRNELEDDHVTFKNEKFKPGLGLRLEVKFYPKEAFKGFFYGISGSFKQNNIIADIYDFPGKNLVLRNYNFSYPYKDIRAIIGNQINDKASNTFYLEWSFGLGLMNFKSEKYPNFIQNNFTTSNTLIYTYTINYYELNKTKINYFASIKIGYRIFKKN